MTSDSKALILPRTAICLNAYLMKWGGPSAMASTGHALPDVSSKSAALKRWRSDFAAGAALTEVKGRMHCPTAPRRMYSLSIDSGAGTAHCPKKLCAIVFLPASWQRPVEIGPGRKCWLPRTKLKVKTVSRPGPFCVVETAQLEAQLICWLENMFRGLGLLPRARPRSRS